MSTRHCMANKARLTGPRPVLESTRRLLLLLIVSLFLGACQQQDSPVFVPTLARPVAGVSLPATETPTYTPSPLPPAPSLTPWPTPDFLGTAVRPQDVQLLRPRDLGPDAPNADWRPPPLPVPVAIHPDDHYWLIRPIPSGERNYDLEWYPFGNDVLIPEYYPYRIHHGLDFPNETGIPILAASSGTVIHAGPLPSARNGVNYYGNTVIIHHDWQWQGKDVYTLYAHTLQLFVQVGDYVEQGQLIAGVGETGEVSGPHLHLEVRVGDNNYYQARNPTLWIAPYEGWGTLAGRLVDRRGEYITNAEVRITPQYGYRPIRVQRTYLYDGVKPDDVWQENFAVGDLPAGRYTVEFDINGTVLEHSVNVLPGRTNFLSIATDFVFVPTATPTATPVFTDTLELSGTIPFSGTLPFPLLETPTP